MVNEKMGIKGVVTVSVKKIDGSVLYLTKNKPNLLTTAGRDWIHSQVYETGTTDEAINIGVSTDTAGPSASDTVLVDEIEDGGLGRTAATYSHTANGNVSTLSVTFTASATHTSVQKSAVFTASTDGTMVHENTFPEVTLTTDDELNVVWTITAG